MNAMSGIELPGRWPSGRIGARTQPEGAGLDELLDLWSGKRCITGLEACPCQSPNEAVNLTGSRWWLKVLAC
jgi:hypothetical protein